MYVIVTINRIRLECETRMCFFQGGDTIMCRVFQNYEYAKFSAQHELVEG
jgi:hypothetical protein